MFLGINGGMWLQTVGLSFFTGGITGFIVYTVLEKLKEKKANKIMDAYKMDE